ncbi:MAG: YCF48-related protein [Candidatus Margulisiibacteriota bacterium]
MRNAFKFLIIACICLFASSSFADGIWVKQYEAPAGQLLNDIYFLSSTEGYACGNGGTILKTTDRGNSWTTVNSGTDESLVGIYADSGKIVVAISAFFGNIIKSTNGGSSWSYKDPIRIEFLTDLWFVNQNYGFAVGKIGGTDNLFWTADAGETWSSVTRSWDLTAVHGIATNDAWTIENRAGVIGFLGTWNGSGWSFIQPTVNLAARGIHQMTTSSGWAVGDFSTTNARLMEGIGGAPPTITSINIGSSSVDLKDVWFVTTSEGWVVGHSGKIYHTTNGGRTAGDWSEQASATTASLEAIHFIDANNGWIAGGSSSLILKYVVSPEVSTISPSSLALGLASQNVTITGSNLQGTSGTDVPVVSFGSGVTVNSVTVNSTTEIVANISIATTTTTGARSITVTNPDTGVGTKASVLTLVPAVNSADPSTLAQGATRTIEVSGYGFQNGATIEVSGAGITINSYSYAQIPTKLLVNISISASAASAARNITVYNPDGTSNTGNSLLSIQSGSVTNPTVLSASPAFAPQGWTGQITVTGQDFQSSATITFSNNNVIDATTGATQIPTTFVSSTSLTINVSVESSAAIGSSNIVVNNPDGGTGTGFSLFNVTSSNPADNPSVEAISNSRTSSNEVIQGETTILVISGANFTSEAEVSFSSKTRDLNILQVSSGITVTSLNSVSTDETKLYITVSVASNAETGYRNITVTNKPGGVILGSGTLADGIRVVSSTPSSIAPPPAIAAPHYPAGEQTWNPEQDGNLAITVDANEGSSNATACLAGPLGPVQIRKVSINPGINTLTLSVKSDGNESLANGVYRYFVIDNGTGRRIANGKFVVYR